MIWSLGFINKIRDISPMHQLKLCLYPKLIAQSFLTLLLPFIRLSDSFCAGKSVVHLFTLDVDNGIPCNVMQMAIDY